MIKGFKVFEPDWTCRGKQYTCPGKFEEDVAPSVCEQGMHFCKKAAQCFEYYAFDPKNKIAEVIAYGTVTEDGNKCCTDKLEIVREIPWNEVLEIVNTGTGNTGYSNSGDWNSGDWNSGDWNNGTHNSGKRNSSNCNSGDWNDGDWNSGNRNSGNRNSGNYNRGDWNSGDYNSGRLNSGDHNNGNYNSGEWNKCDRSSGVFNTESHKIYMFNKPSEWKYVDWLNSDARKLLQRLANVPLKFVSFSDMTAEERASHPEAEVTGGYLKETDLSECAVEWWHKLTDREKAVIKAIPNFDKDIFKEIVGVDVDKD